MLLLTSQNREEQSQVIKNNYEIYKVKHGEGEYRSWN